MRKLWGSIAHTSGAKAYSLVVGLAILSITARFLGPEGRGQVAVVMTWIGMFCTFSYLSLGQVALHLISDDSKNEFIGNLLSSLIVMTVILTSICWLVAIGMYCYIPNNAFKNLPPLALLVGFITLPFMIWEQYGSVLLMGIDKVRLYNRYQIIGRTASVIAVILLTGIFSAGVPGVIGANLLGQSIVALGTIAFLIKYVHERGLSFKLKKSDTIRLLSGGFKLHFNAIGYFLFTSANVLILNEYHGAGQTAYFQLATSLLGVLMIIPQSASMVIYGKVTSLGPDRAWPYNRNLLLQTTIIMIGLSVIAAVVAPWGIVLLAGDAFEPAVQLFQWMLFGLIGMSFSAVMAPQWILRGYFWQAAGLTFLVGVINLAANFWLIPPYGMDGAVYAFLGTYVISIFGNGGMALHCEKKYRRHKLNKKEGGLYV